MLQRRKQWKSRRALAMRALTDHQSAAMIAIVQLARWCRLGMKWLWPTRRGQKPIREEAASEEPRCTGGFTSDETKNELPEHNGTRQQEHGGVRYGDARIS